MAVVLAFRIAVALAPGGVRVVKWAEGPGVEEGVRLAKELQQRLADPAESDADLGAAVSAASGRMASVATYSTTFELRKLQVLFGRASGAALPEDDAVITYHFLRLAAGAPSDAWVAADFVAIETAFDNFWSAIKIDFANSLTLRQMRWYATGPQIDVALGGPGRTGPPRRVVDRNVAGGAMGSAMTSPQLAISVTEKTSDARAWGRFYLPGPFQPGGLMTAVGRLLTAGQTGIANAADTFYEAALANGTPVVVYSAAKPARATAAGGSLPAAVARALTVDNLQVDDIVDVIRSRRWNSPLLRLQRQVGA